MRETSRTCNFPRTTHGGKAEIVMWRRLHTVRPAPAPWRDSHVNIYHDYYYFNPPKILSTHTTTKQGFQVSTHLAFHFHSVAVRISQRLRLIKAPIHFFPVWRKKKKKKSSVAFAHRERGSGPGLSALKKFSLFASSTELRVSFTSPTSFFFSQCAPTDMREDFTREQEVCDSPRWLEECELSFENDISPL